MRHMGRATHEARDACYGNRGSECALSRLNRSTRITHSMHTQPAQSEYSASTVRAGVSGGAASLCGSIGGGALARLHYKYREGRCRGA